MPAENHQRLRGKVMLVTGAGTGIGSAICIEAARAGADIAICYFTSRAGALAVRNKVVAAGSRAIILKADVGKPRQAERLVAQTVSELGGLHVLVNNAATVIRSPLLKITEEDWSRTIDVNLRGTFICLQAAARVMVARRSGGRIINVSSVGGLLAHDDLAAYDASKAAINMLTRCAGLELGRHGITVNAIAPGAIEVDRNRWEFKGDAKSRKWKSIIPLGRWGRPEEIARAVVFLASEDAGFINGEVLVIDGGQSIMIPQP